jgi:hypothetical protein
MDCASANTVMLVHPTAANCCRGFMSYVTPKLIEYPHDTARAITSLVMHIAAGDRYGPS